MEKNTILEVKDKSGESLLEVSGNGKEKEFDAFEAVRKHEKLVKARLFIKSLEQIKKLSREILESKEKCLAILEEVGIKDAEIKKVIDFVNETVKLTEEDRKDIRQSIKKSVKSDKEDANKKVIETTEKNNWGFYTTSNNWNAGAGTGTGTPLNSQYYITCDSSSGEGGLKVTI